jgi:hypothetical protein
MVSLCAAEPLDHGRGSLHVFSCRGTVSQMTIVIKNPAAATIIMNQGEKNRPFVMELAPIMFVRHLYELCQLNDHHSTAIIIIRQKNGFTLS